MVSYTKEVKEGMEAYYAKRGRNSFLEKERMTLLGMKDDDLDDALYNLKVQAVNLVTDALLAFIWYRCGSCYSITGLTALDHDQLNLKWIDDV